MMFSRKRATFALAFMAAIVTLSNAQELFDPDDAQDNELDPDALHQNEFKLDPDVGSEATETEFTESESTDDNEVWADPNEASDADTENLTPQPDPEQKEDQPEPTPPTPTPANEKESPAPSTEAPNTEPPKTEPPKTEPPKTEAPRTSSPSVTPTPLPSPSATPSPKPSTSAPASEASEPAKNMNTRVQATAKPDEKLQEKKEPINESNTTSSNSSGMQGWSIGAIILGIVGSVLIAAAFLHKRSKRHHHDKEISSHMNEVYGQTRSTLYRYNNGSSEYEAMDDLRAIDFSTPKEETTASSFTSTYNHVDNHDHNSRSLPNDFEPILMDLSNNNKTPYIFYDESQFHQDPQEESPDLSELGDHSISSSFLNSNIIAPMDLGRFSLDSAIEDDDQIQQQVEQNDEKAISNGQRRDSIQSSVRSEDSYRGDSDTSPYRCGSEIPTKHLSFQSSRYDSESKHSEMSSTRGNSYDSGVDPRNSFTSDLIDERVSFNSTYEPDTQAEKVASFISYGSAKKNDEDADYSFRIGDENSWGLGDEASTHVYRLSEEGTI